MYVLGMLISVAVTLAVIVGAAALLVTTVLGAVRGPNERLANRPWTRVFLLFVSAGLGVMILGMVYGVARMLGLAPA